MKNFHNTNCSKSNAAIEVLRDRKITVEVINYLEKPLNKKEIIELLNVLKKRPIEIVRHRVIAWVEI